MATGRRRKAAPAFTTLAVCADWTMAHCVIPDGPDAGLPFIFSDDQLQFWANDYLVKPTAKVGQCGSAFVYRRSQLVRVQKAGKSPFAASKICNEAVGPALFAGWAAGGERYRCTDRGCGCGWVYEYEPGEPMGRAWPTPLIQVTAATVEQTDNVYDALRPMIERGPLAELIPKTGAEFIRTPNGGRIDTVTSSARGRLGARVTFVPQDETGIWTMASGMVKVAEVQRRGLAGMDGRATEYTNTWDPSEQSVAQRTFESKAKDVLRDYRRPPAGLSFRVKAERLKILRYQYQHAPWVKVPAVEAEAVELMEKDPAQAERFFGNFITAGNDTYLDRTDWDRRAARREVPPGSRIVLGFDGSDTDDWTVLRAETLDGYQFTPGVGPDGGVTIWNPAEYGGQVPRLDVDAAVRALFATFDVVLMYGDPPYWQSELDGWAAEFGEQTVRRFETYRPVQMHAALERFHTDVKAKSGPLTHDGDDTIGQHIANARKAPRPGHRYVIVKASQAQKIDGCMASVIAHEAAGDAIAAGLNAPTDASYGFAYA